MPDPTENNLSQPFEPVRIAFQMDDAYLLDSIRNDPDRSAFRRKKYLILSPIALAGITFVILSAVRHDRQSLIPSCGMLAIVGIMLSRWSPTGILRERRKRLQQMFRQYPIGHKIEFGSDGFIVLLADGVSNFHPWPSILRVVEQAPGLAIYIQTNFRYWIPAGTFSNPHDYRRTIELINRKVARVERMG